LGKGFSEEIGDRDKFARIGRHQGTRITITWVKHRHRRLSADPHTLAFHRFCRRAGYSKPRLPRKVRKVVLLVIYFFMMDLIWEEQRETPYAGARPESDRPHIRLHQDYRRLTNVCLQPHHCLHSILTLPPTCLISHLQVLPLPFNPLKESAKAQ
jgi:hypothetical protein